MCDGVLYAKGHVNKIPMLQLSTRTFRNTLSASYMLSLTDMSGNSEIMHCGILLNIAICGNQPLE